MSQEKTPEQSSGRKKRKEVVAKDIQGLKYFKVLRPLLKRLHDVGTGRDHAQNRQLHKHGLPGTQHLAGIA
jgi:hypothetical protein